MKKALSKADSAYDADLLVPVRNGANCLYQKLILPEINRLEALRSEVDVAICDLGVVTMGSFSVRCRTRPFEGR